MPNPKKYKNKKLFMKDCIHQTCHVENKSRDQGIAICLNMWKNKNRAKKIASDYLNSFNFTN